MLVRVSLDFLFFKILSDAKLSNLRVGKKIDNSWKIKPPNLSSLRSLIYIVKYNILEICGWILGMMKNPDATSQTSQTSANTVHILRFSIYVNIYLFIIYPAYRIMALLIFQTP